MYIYIYIYIYIGRTIERDVLRGGKVQPHIAKHMYVLRYFWLKL